MAERKEFYHVYADEHCTRRLRTAVVRDHEQAFLDWWFEAANGVTEIPDS